MTPEQLNKDGTGEVRRRRIDNWPPDGRTYVDAPVGLSQQIEDAERTLKTLRGELRAWERQTERRRTACWIAYHDQNGWPDDDDYRRRMMRKDRENNA